MLLALGAQPPSVGQHSLASCSKTPSLSALKYSCRVLLRSLAAARDFRPLHLRQLNPVKSQAHQWSCVEDVRALVRVQDCPSLVDKYWTADVPLHHVSCSLTEHESSLK